MKRRSISLALGAAFVLLAGSCDNPTGAGSAFQPLEFPFADPSSIVRMAAFGIPNWSGTEPHNGTDFQVREGLSSTRILSPTAGKVTAVRADENPFALPPGQLILGIEIRVNDEWTVSLALEPSTVDPALKSAQRAAVLVEVGQEVAAGTPVADLLVGSLGYPHLHYMVMRGSTRVCAYAHSSEAARRTMEAIAALPGSTVPGGQICVVESF
jgi:murein DD-endopeptidase MepM/ murein hydrolase activator NlpD